MPALPGFAVHQQQWDEIYIEIRDHGDLRSLYFDRQYLQSSMSLSDPVRLVLSYTQIMAFAMLLTSEPKKILMIGVGAGSLLRFFHHHFPDAIIDAVDNSPHVIALARGWFGLPENDKISVYCQDGLDFLKHHPTNDYDLIMIDAYDGKGMAPSVYTEDFLTIASQRLAESGVIAANTWSGDANYFDFVQTSFHSVYTGLLNLPVPDRGNVVLIAMTEPIPWHRLETYSQSALSQMGKKYSFNLRKLMKLARQSNLSIGRRIVRLFS